MQVTSEQVIQALNGVAPDMIRVHAVEVNGVDYPVIQALAVATGIDRAEINSIVARSKLKKLGFTVKRVAG